MIPTGSFFSLFPCRNVKQGLSTVIYQNAGSGGNWWPTDLDKHGYEFTIGPYVPSDIYIPSTSGGLPGYSHVRDYFAVRFSGLLNVVTAGSYQFFLTSDDGSRLVIGNNEFIHHGGFHGMSTMSATVELPEGEIDHNGGDVPRCWIFRAHLRMAGCRFRILCRQTFR